MITFKLPAKLLVTAAGLAGVITALSLFGAFPAGNGTLHPVIARGLPFAKPADASAPLRVAIYPGGAFAAGLLANGGLATAKDSLFEKEQKLGVEFLIVEDPDRCMRLLGAHGGADIVWSTVPVLTRHYKKHCSLNPVAFMQYGYSRGEDALFSERAYTVPAELKGASIACVQGGSPHFLLLYILHSAGINPGELKWRYTHSDSDAALLLQKGRVQVCGVSTAATAVPSSFKLIVSSAQASKLLPGIFITREDMLIRKKDQIARFAAGWFRGVTELQKNRDTAVKILATSYGCDDKKAEELLRGAIHTGYADNASFFGTGKSVLPGFDHLAGISASLWKQDDDTLSNPCEITRNTDILVAIADSMKKTVGGFSTEPSESVKTPALAVLTGEYPVEFSAADSSPEFRAHMAVERFARVAGLLEGSPVFLYGSAGTPEEQAYSYNWGMRFYIVGKMLTDLGIPKERISIKEIRLDPGLAGSQKHRVSCVIGR